jgi:DNA-binding PadR family transcriptional regulator
MSKESKASFVILGLLSLQPMSGYEIKKTIERTISHFWQESFGNIYPTLKRLLERKMVSREVVAQSGKPDRHVYSLTDRGMEELMIWLEEPVDRIPVRNELLLKICFSRLVDPKITIANLERHLRNLRQFLGQYEGFEQIVEQDATTREDKESVPYWVYTIRYGIHSVRGRIRWCEETLADLRARSKPVEE